MGLEDTKLGTDIPIVENSKQNISWPEFLMARFPRACQFLNSLEASGQTTQTILDSWSSKNRNYLAAQKTERSALPEDERSGYKLENDIPSELGAFLELQIQAPSWETELRSKIKENTDLDILPSTLAMSIENDFSKKYTLNNLRQNGRIGLFVMVIQEILPQTPRILATVAEGSVNAGANPNQPPAELVSPEKLARREASAKSLELLDKLYLPEQKQIFDWTLRLRNNLQSDFFALCLEINEQIKQGKIDAKVLLSEKGKSPESLDAAIQVIESLSTFDALDDYDKTEFLNLLFKRHLIRQAQRAENTKSFLNNPKLLAEIKKSEIVEIANALYKRDTSTLVEILKNATQKGFLAASFNDFDYLNKLLDDFGNLPLQFAVAKISREYAGQILLCPYPGKQDHFFAIPTWSGTVTKDILNTLRRAFNMGTYDKPLSGQYVVHANWPAILKKIGDDYVTVQKGDIDLNE